jgi:UDP-N-acetyl-2-amino-2-deoxyglucuronate dehydrogenase
MKGAIIGCGRISYKHVEAFNNNKDKVKLVALCDIDERKAKEKKFNDEIKVYTDYKKLLSEVKPDFVTVTTWSGNHAEITVDALKSGAHVLVEKPMALSTSDASLMIETAKKENKKLAVCFQNRFNAPIQKTYEALKNDRFGKILNGSIQVRWNRNEDYYNEASWRGTWDMDGGTLMNQCTHGIDLLQWLMGEDVVKVHGVTRKFLKNIEAEDFGAALLEFKSGAVGMIEGSANVYPKNLNETLSIFGETGSAVIGGLAVNKIETWRFSDAEKFGETEDKVINPDAKDPDTVYGFGHSAILKDFISAIKEDRDPFICGEKGKKALDIILAIYKSMKEKKAVEMPLDFSTKEMEDVL